MTQKWNLQDIRPAEPRKRRMPPKEVREMQTNENGVVSRPAEREHIPSIIIEDGRKKDSNRLIISIILFVVIVGGAVGLSAILGKTELTVYPEYREPNINAEFTAYPDKRTGSLSYEIMTLEATSESQVKASGKVEVKELATGMIEIIKTTPGAERLIKNTRFRTPAGLVYRIKESVVVPGAVKDGEGASVPGTIQAEVFADEVGEQYNVSAGTTFDVPGFKEGGFTDLYNAISARNTVPFSNGFDGPQFQIDESELNTARQQLQVDLRNNLLARIDTEKPADFIAFKDAVAITYNQLTPVQNGQDLVTIREQAILQIPLFQAIEFGSFLAQESVTTYEGNPVRVDDPSVLTFRYTSATTSSSVIANEPSLTFNLSGKPLLIWEYDIEKLKKDLAGLPKTAINNAILAYPGIDGAKVHITPFWQRTFAEKPEDILVVEELKQIQKPTE
ncbi:hypothetical protein H6784_00890 [Candidatus Nomurabacteria bacterium]|nr:hypothetical protein [Candidatus Kaiserbacteria bacterium]MCB9813948.1 hypothetical protein [Candidatus Nomurabacteria bacterium]